MCYAPGVMLPLGLTSRRNLELERRVLKVPIEQLHLHFFLSVAAIENLERLGGPSIVSLPLPNVL